MSAIKEGISSQHFFYALLTPCVCIHVCMCVRAFLLVSLSPTALPPPLFVRVRTYIYFYPHLPSLPFPSQVSLVIDLHSTVPRTNSNPIPNLHLHRRPCLIYTYNANANSSSKCKSDSNLLTYKPK